MQKIDENKLQNLLVFLKFYFQTTFIMWNLKVNAQ